MAEKLWEGEIGGDIYECGGGGRDSGTGEWAISIWAGASQIYPRVKTEKGEDPPD